MNLTITQVDYGDKKQGADLLALLNHYAQDPMGGGQPLLSSVTDTLVENLAKLPHAISVLAYDEEDQALGLINAFEGFSTFANEPLINVHDIVVHRAHRGKGIAQKLLAVIEEIAKVRGCCKLTLEVLTGNHTAQSSYRRFGFNPYEIRPGDGQALFWHKKLV